MSSKSKSEQEDHMTIEETIAIKLLTKLLLDSVKKVFQKSHDIYSDVFDDSINKLAPKYPNLTTIHIDSFLYESPAEDLMKKYIEHPENYINCSKKELFSEKLIEEFITFFEEQCFSREEVKEIVTDFLGILDDNIQKNPDLRDKLILDYAKDTNKELKKHIEESRIHIKSFLNLKEFFSRSLESTNLLNHTYPFIGRNEILSQLDSFIKSDKKIALLPGRGGIGKSRILLEFGKSFESKHNEWELRYVSENTLTQESIRELPDRKCILVVDDAHRREDIVTLLETAQQAKNPTKVILAFRPHGVDYIKNICNRCGFDICEIEKLLEVMSLNRNEKEELGRKIIGEKYLHYLEPLIQVSKDSTIVLVIGARLIAEGKVQPALLERDQEFQEVVFRRFKEDIISGLISEDLDATDCRDLLDIISILSPIQKDKEFIEKIAKFFEIKISKLTRSIDTLERGRVLYKVGSKLRITPDVLSDHILYEACITSDGLSTGYAQEIFKAFGDDYLKEILDNLSEIDWRVTRNNRESDLRNNRESDLLIEIWENIVEKFKNSSNLDRTILLDKFEKVAYFQPKRILELIKYAVNNPLNTSNRDCASFKLTHEDVLKKIPPLLKNISYNFEYLLPSCKLLWDLAKKEIKKQTNTSNYALKAIVDLAEYEMYKSFEYNSQIITFVEKEIKDDRNPKEICSLLEILDPMLKKEIVSAKLIEFKMEFRSYSIPYENVKEIRRKAIWLIGDQLNSRSTKVVLRALKSLIEALRPPTGDSRREVPTDEINRWLPEQMEILQIIECISKITTDPIVKIQIKSSLAWYARQNNQPDVADKASSIIKSLPEDFDTKFMRAIWYHYDIDYNSFRENQEKRSQEIEEIAREFLDRYNNEEEKIFDILNEAIEKFEISEITIYPADFMVEISTIDYEIACEVCNHIISDTSKPLANYLEFLLSGIRKKDESTAIKLIELAVDSSKPVLCRSIAEGYAHRGWALNLRTEEINIITQLLGSLEADTKNLAIESLGQFPNILRNEAIEIALGVEIGNNEKIADTYCGIFNPEYGIPPESLDETQLKLILKKICQVQVIKEDLYNLNIFLTYCSTRIPEKLVDFLLGRVDLSKKVEYSTSNRFQPLPFNGFYDKGLKAISLSPNYKNMLRKIRDKSLNSDSKEPFWLPKLYSEVSVNYSLASLEVLNEWIDTGDEEKIKAVGLLMRETPSDFIFLQSDFISNLLTDAQAISDDCYGKVRYYISHSALYGVKTGIAGQASYEDEKIRDRAQEFMEMYPAGSPTWNFYNWLSEQAKILIKRWLEKDEEMIQD